MFGWKTIYLSRINRSSFSHLWQHYCLLSLSLYYIYKISWEFYIRIGKVKCYTNINIIYSYYYHFSYKFLPDWGGEFVHILYKLEYLDLTREISCIPVDAPLFLKENDVACSHFLFLTKNILMNTFGNGIAPRDLVQLILHQIKWEFQH